MDLLTRELENVINSLVRETIEEGATSDRDSVVDPTSRRNSLHDKIGYLLGEEVVMFDVDGNLVEFNIQRKISRSVAKLFHHLRHRRNGFVHGYEALYNVINNFENIVVETSHNQLVIFNGGQLTYSTDRGAHTVDFIAGSAHNHDLLIEVYTRQEFVSSGGGLGGIAVNNPTHIVLLYYGNKKFVFAFTRTSFNKWKRAFFGNDTYHRRTMYFKFKIERLVERIKYHHDNKRQRMS